MDKLYFEGCLTAFAGDARENDPFCKLTIKTKEDSTIHALLNAFRSKDEGIDSAYKWANTPGTSRASFMLTHPLDLGVDFDIFSFKATLVSITMSKRSTEDLGTIVEYAFNFEKCPEDEDSRFWMSYLKQKEDPADLVPEESGRMPKPKALEYHVELRDTGELEELPAPDDVPKGIASGLDEGTEASA